MATATTTTTRVDETPASPSPSSRASSPRSASPSSSRSSHSSPSTKPTPYQAYNFTFAPHLLATQRFGIPPSAPICPIYRSTNGACPLGGNCPDKHPLHLPPSGQPPGTSNLVCKHWLKGLCKKGDSCDFLHEWNIRARSECRQWAATSGAYCVQGDDCNYLHPDPKALEERRRRVCEWYERGFCPLGPRCNKRHIKTYAYPSARTSNNGSATAATSGGLCKFYLAGFCPDGVTQSQGQTHHHSQARRVGCVNGAHAKWKEDSALPAPEVRLERSAEEMEAERERIRAEAEEREQREWESRNSGAGGGAGAGGQDGGYGRGRGRGKRGFGKRNRGMPY